MTERHAGWIAWCGIGLAGFSLLLVVVNIVLAVVNGHTQAEVSARQQFIADAPQYNAIGEALVRSLNAAASTTNDPALIAMMQRHGLNPSAGASPSPAKRAR
jgi:hypothetical protein